MNVVKPTIIVVVLGLIFLGVGPGVTRALAQDANGFEFESDKKKAAEPATKSATSDEKNEDGDIGILTETIPEIAGPKRTVSVGKFDAIGAFTAKYGNWDIGGGLSAMMTTALVESERFVVMERAQLQQVLAEQELKGNKLTSQTSGPELGQLTGVQFLIYGAVTEFGTDDSGGGLSLGGSGGPIGGLLSGALSHQSSSGSVAMDIRLVDTTTGQVVQTHKVSETIESSGFDLSVGYQGMNMGGNQFKKTPLGQAVRKAITRAVQLIAKDAGNSPWAGQVVDYDGTEIFINAGTKSGVQPGDTFSVERVVKKLTDPTTGEVLMIKKKTLGIVELDMVAAKISSGSFQPLEMDPPKRGDFVIVMKR